MMANQIYVICHSNRWPA
uniref:Uncharacterized protein n=1 Tax=Arundo donax TaxID=35708 RepID=A0A0A9A0Q7_ARUDO